MKTQLHKRHLTPVWYKSLSNSFDFDVPSRMVSGYLAAFGNVDEDRDVIIKGAFAKSLQEHGPGALSPRKVAYLYQHDYKEPLGRFKILQEDDKGLYFEAEIDATERGDQVLYQYSSGTLNQHSIGFRYVWDKLEYVEPEDYFIVKEVRLFEGSVVTIGANENTPFTGFKACEIVTVQEGLIQEFEQVARRLGATDEYTLRQVVSKLLALADEKPPQVVKTAPALPPEAEPPRRIDWSKVNQSIFKQTKI